MFSRKVVDRLVGRVARADFDANALAELIYQLETPFNHVPAVFAAVIAGRPDLHQPRSVFARRLAYGIIDRCFELLDHTARVQMLRKLCRKVKAIDIELEKLGASTEVIKYFSVAFDQYVYGCNAVRDLADSEDPERAIIATLVERLVAAATYQQELMQLLIERILREMEPAQRRQMAERVNEAVNEGLKNPSLEETHDPDKLISDLNGPIQFSKADLEDGFFVQTAEQLAEYLKDTYLR